MAAMTTVATVDDVATSLGVTVPSAGSIEFAQWNMWLGDAELQIVSRCGLVADLNPAVVAFIEREAVVMKIKNPDPVSTRQISVDDGSESTTWQRTTGTVTILPEWWDMLNTTSTGKAYEIDTMPKTAGPFGRCGVDYVWTSTTDWTYLP